mmetsp:Transcript_27210/g.66036  ORF Transcript_27210/g.66036 Transcript_27210/m.66036 type:complete len:178 (+) Transcript_27210:632-1165(+)
MDGPYSDTPEQKRAAKATIQRQAKSAENPKTEAPIPSKPLETINSPAAHVATGPCFFRIEPTEVADIKKLMHAMKVYTNPMLFASKSASCFSSCEKNAWKVASPILNRNDTMKIEVAPRVTALNENGAEPSSLCIFLFHFSLAYDSLTNSITAMEATIDATAETPMTIDREADESKS